MTDASYDQRYAERQLGRSNNPLRRIIKRFYLNNLLKDVRGLAIDFGCGAGQLLERMPNGSLGLEVNPNLVAALRARHLNAQIYDPDMDQLSLKELPSRHYQTFVMSHVLEHLDNAAEALRSILRSCSRLGIERVIIVLPCEKGYAFDSTHRTFVNRKYIDDNNLREHSGYAVKYMDYFPFNSEVVGKYFVFNEFKVVYEKS